MYHNGMNLIGYMSNSGQTFTYSVYVPRVASFVLPNLVNNAVLLFALQYCNDTGDITKRDLAVEPHRASITQYT